MGLFPKNLNEYVASLGIPRGPKSQAFLVDTVNGDDDNNGQSWQKPLASLEAAEDLCTAEQHDTVLFLPGDTADSPTAAIAWDKDHTHLIGLGAPFEGMGNRNRVVGTAALDLTPVITFSGRGCIVKNMQFQNLKDASETSGTVLVSGPYNYFENVYFNGMNHATAGAQAGSYCLSVTGAENLFVNSTIGSCQTIRAAANAEMLVTNGANTWRHCRFQAYSETSGKFLVSVSPPVGGLGDLVFEDCFFYCQTVNWATGIAAAFHVGSGGSHYVVLRGHNDFLGCTAVADTLTHVYAPNAAADVSGLLMIAVAES